MTDKNKALHEAVFNDDIELINKLISEGANVNGDGYMGPLHEAVYRGNYTAAEALIKAGADVSMPICVGCYTPLYIAVCWGHKDIVELLVGSEADINRGNNYNETPLIVSAKRAYEDIYNFLIEHGADITIEDSIHGTAAECLRLAKIAKENNGGVWPPEYGKNK